MRHYLALKLDRIRLLGAVTILTKKRAWNFQNMDISSGKTSDGFFLMLLVARIPLQIGTIRQFYKDNFNNKICNSFFILMLTVAPTILKFVAVQHHIKIKWTQDSKIMVREGDNLVKGCERRQIMCSVLQFSRSYSQFWLVIFFLINQNWE